MAMNYFGAFCLISQIAFNSHNVQALLLQGVDTFGYVDTFEYVSANIQGCLEEYPSNSFYYHLTIRLAHCNTGSVDANALKTIKDNTFIPFPGYVVTIIQLSGYIIPCFCCEKPPEHYIKPIFDAMFGAMQDDLPKFPTFEYLFIDVEPCTFFHNHTKVEFCGKDNKTANEYIKMIQNVINEAEKVNTGYGQKGPIYRQLGIYASRNDWMMLVNNTNEFNQYPLWYPHYGQQHANATVDCSDWGKKKFGGWSQPTFRQYAENVQICGQDFDRSVSC